MILTPRIAIIFLLFFFFLPSISHAGEKSLSDSDDPVSTLGCQTEQKKCVGKYGEGCYSPAGGQECFDGLICPPGRRACFGDKEARCYDPASGQQCFNGLVCEIGRKPCTGSQGASCFDPALGEECNNGLVCKSGKKACIGEYGGSCYDPSIGQECIDGKVYFPDQKRVIKPKTYPPRIERPKVLKKGKKKDKASITCPPQLRKCVGENGSGCYDPARGQQCYDGLICRPGQRGCIGPYGAGCYEIGRGYQCNEGLICPPGKRACYDGKDKAYCYDPSRGQSCD